MHLVIGNKNTSSWSMRPWVLMRQLGIAFEETKLRFDFKPGSAFRQAVAQISPAGLVPVLVDDGFCVWDTLAITEYLHEQFPQAGVWPAKQQVRARARSVSAEMHSGFSALRSHCPMNIAADLSTAGDRIWAEQEGVRDNVARIESLWADALHSSGGPFLFGEFCAADAFFAPVAMRLTRYALPATAASQAYMQRVAQAPGVAAWISDAMAEQDFPDLEEPDRSQR